MEYTPFTIKARVYYEDTDAGGIVYYANYLKFCERARTEWLRSMGMSQCSMLEQKEGFVIRNIAGSYVSSAKLDDELTISCIPIKARFASLSFYQEIYNQRNQLLFQFECNIAFINLLTGKPSAMPKAALEYAKSYIPLDLTSFGLKK